MSQEEHDERVRFGIKVFLVAATGVGGVMFVLEAIRDPSEGFWGYLIRGVMLVFGIALLREAWRAAGHGFH